MLLCFRNLGESVSSIELDTKAVSVEQLQHIEELVNEKIMAGTAMYPTLYDSVDHPDIKQVL